MISIEGAASHLSDFYNEEQQMWKTIIYVNFSRIFRESWLIYRAYLKLYMPISLNDTANTSLFTFWFI